MSLRNILIILLTLAYFAFCYKYFNKDFFPTCCSTEKVSSNENSNTAVIPPSINNEKLKPITFAFDSAEPELTDEFEGIKADLFAASKENDMLEITGYYFEGEGKPENYDDMGIYRAMKIIELISPPLDQDKITVVSEKIEELDDAREKNFESHSFKWQTQKESDEPKLTTSSDGEVSILFALNSTKYEESEELDRYLDEIAEKLKSDKDLMAYVVGHADKSGSASANQRLSLQRAKKIRRILRNKGVSSGQLVAKGRGEHQNKAPNNSEAERRLNRRVEILIDTRDK